MGKPILVFSDFIYCLQTFFLKTIRSKNSLSICMCYFIFYVCYYV